MLTDSADPIGVWVEVVLSGPLWVPQPANRTTVKMLNARFIVILAIFEDAVVAY